MIESLSVDNLLAITYDFITKRNNSIVVEYKLGFNFFVKASYLTSLFLFLCYNNY